MMRMSPAYAAPHLESACVELLIKNGYREDVHLMPAIYFGMGQDIFSYTPDTIDTGMCDRRTSKVSTGIWLRDTRVHQFLDADF